MFENIYILVIGHILFIQTGVLLFAPVRYFRWGWMWILQILVTEWPALWMVLLGFACFENWTFLIYVPLIYCYLKSRHTEFRNYQIQVDTLKKDMNHSPYSLLQEIIHFFWPFQKSPKLTKETFIFASGISHDFYPKKNSECLLIHIHGGAWIHGNSEQLKSNFSIFKQLNCDILSVNYFKLPEHNLNEICTALEQDLNEILVRFKKKKIILYGRSAGAHLALTMAQRFSSLPFHVVALYPISDLKSFFMAGNKNDILNTPELIRMALRINRNEMIKEEHFESCKDLSPLQCLANTQSKYFIIHGENDPVVPFQQSELLFTSLLDKKYPSLYLRFSKGTHGFDGVPNGPSMKIFKKYLHHFLMDRS